MGVSRSAGRFQMGRLMGMAGTRLEHFAGERRPDRRLDPVLGVWLDGTQKGRAHQQPDSQNPTQGRGDMGRRGHDHPFPKAARDG